MGLYIVHPKRNKVSIDKKPPILGGFDLATVVNLPQNIETYRINCKRPTAFIKENGKFFSAI